MCSMTFVIGSAIMRVDASMYIIRKSIELPAEKGRSPGYCIINLALCMVVMGRQRPADTVPARLTFGAAAKVSVVAVVAEKQ